MPSQEEKIHCDTRDTQEERYEELLNLEDKSLEYLLKHHYREMTPGDETINKQLKEMGGSIGTEDSQRQMWQGMIEYDRRLHTRTTGHLSWTLPMIIFQRRLQERKIIKGILRARISKRHREIPRDGSRDRIAELTTPSTMAPTLMLPTMGRPHTCDE